MWGQFEAIDEVGSPPGASSTASGVALGDQQRQQPQQQQQQQQQLPVLSNVVVRPGMQSASSSALRTTKPRLEPKKLAFAEQRTSSANLGLSSPIKGSPSCPDFGSLQAAHGRVVASGLTISEAKGELWKLRLAGTLIKRGFRHRKLWVPRWVVLAGRMLTYYEGAEDEKRESSGASRVRGTLELTKDSLVVEGDSSSTASAAPVMDADSGDGNQAYYEFTVLPKGNAVSSTSALSSKLFLDEELSSDEFIPPGGVSTVISVGSDKVSSPPLPNTNNASSSFLDISSWFRGSSSGPNTAGSDDIWRFRARSEEERKLWIRAIRKSIALVKRVEVAPTLVGVGSVHDHYDIGKVIGRGKFGFIRIGVAKQTGQEYAVKVVNKNKNVRSDADARVLRNEIRVMRRVTRQHDHPNICKLFQAYEDSFMVYLVMEPLLGGNLLDRVAKKGTYDETGAANILRQISGALVELHSNGIVLCDLRPETLLFSKPNSEVIKIVEFGRALIMPPVVASAPVVVPNASSNNGALHVTKSSVNGSIQSSVSSSTVATSFTHAQLLGAPGYIAPEVVSHKQYSPACDIWSLGCTLFFIISGYPAFSGDSTEMILRRSVQGLTETQLKTAWKTKSEDGKDLLTSMLSVDRMSRITAQGILSHPWMRSFLPPESAVGDVVDPLKTPPEEAPSVSDMEARNEYFALDARAEKVRARSSILAAASAAASESQSKNLRLSSRLEDLGMGRRPRESEDDESGFGNGIGIRSIGFEDDKYSNASRIKREPGPFLLALERQLKLEAGLGSRVGSNSSTPSLNSLDDGSSSQLLINHAISERDVERKLRQVAGKLS